GPLRLELMGAQPRAAAPGAREVGEDGAAQLKSNSGRYVARAKLHGRAGNTGATKNASNAGVLVCRCGFQPSRVAQLSTTSAPHLAFHSFRVLWLPPLVSITSPLCGFLYCLTLRARLVTAGLLARAVLPALASGASRAMMSRRDF